MRIYSYNASSRVLIGGINVLLSVILVAGMVACSKSAGRADQQGEAAGSTGQGSVASATGESSGGGIRGSAQDPGSQTTDPSLDQAAAADVQTDASTELGAGISDTTGSSGSLASTEAVSAAVDPAVEAARQAAAARQAEARRLANLNVPDPHISEPSNVITAAITVSLSVDQREAVIHYTTDGSNPGRNAGTRYTGPIQVSSTTVIRAVAFVVGGKISSIVERDYAFNEVYVALGGTGPGTRRQPAGSLASALQTAREKRIPIIKIAAGTYPVMSEIDFAVSISGSWQADFSARASTATVLKGLEVPRSTKQEPAYALKYSGNVITNSVFLEYIEIRGAEASYSTGLLITNRAAPLIRSVQSFGGFASYGYGAVIMANAHPVIRFSRLSGGEGATAYGLSLDSAQATVESSWLLAGSGNVGGYGATVTDARLKASSSVFAGNQANTSYAIAFYNSSGSELENCSLIGGSGRDVAAVFSSVSNPSIVNCLLTAHGTGRSYGYQANFGNSSPARLQNNVFVGCAGGLYYRVDNRQSYTAVNADGNLTLADGTGLPGSIARANSSSTVMPGGEPDYRSPANHGWPAGRVLSGAAATDIAGTQRSGNWTPGAWQ